MDAFLPVLDCWSFHGEYGIQMHGPLTLDKPETDFSGCGRWDFSGTLEAFDCWTWDWIKNPGSDRHPLTEEQYQRFLGLMAEQGTRIYIEFNDRDTSVGFNVDVTGQFISDGRHLSYETLSAEKPVPPSWEECGPSAFSGAVKYFMSLAPNADKRRVKEWVGRSICPSNFFSSGTVDFSDYYGCDGEEYFPETDMQNFKRLFSPSGEAWEEAVATADDFLGWELA